MTNRTRCNASSNLRLLLLLNRLLMWLISHFRLESSIDKTDSIYIIDKGLANKNLMITLDLSRKYKITCCGWGFVWICWAELAWIYVTWPLGCWTGWRKTTLCCAACICPLFITTKIMCLSQRQFDTLVAIRKPIKASYLGFDFALVIFE